MKPLRESASIGAICGSNHSEGFIRRFTQRHTDETPSRIGVHRRNLRTNHSEGFCHGCRQLTTHGHAHRDQYDRRGRQTKAPLNLSFEHALTYSDWDLNENWQRYVAEFRGSKGT
jgi:hypothetical protein